MRPWERHALLLLFLIGLVTFYGFFWGVRHGPWGTGFAVACLGSYGIGALSVFQAVTIPCPVCRRRRSPETFCANTTHEHDDACCTRCCRAAAPAPGNPAAG